MADTIPGGKYISADGYWQNAEGQYIDEDGKVVKEPVKAHQPKPNSAPAKQPNEK
jgi:hypothetical protein